MRIRTLALMAVIVVTFMVLLSSVGLAQEVVSLPRHVMPGGGTVSENSGYTLMGSIGQPFTARSGDGAYRLHAGYWTSHSTSTLENHRVHLPLIQR